MSCVFANILPFVALSLYAVISIFLPLLPSMYVFFKVFVLFTPTYEYMFPDMAVKIYFGKTYFRIQCFYINHIYIYTCI